MTMFRWSAVLCLAAMVSLNAQVRDISAPSGVGVTGRIQGRVVTSGTDPRPVRRAIVTVTGDGIKDGRSAITDDQGAFVFDALPPGRLLLTATKAAHLPAAYGSALPGRPPVAIQLRAGEQRAGVTLVMYRAAAITGSVRMESGDPAPGVDVVAFRLPPPGQNSHLIPTSSSLTDDRGIYRIFDLAPGDYVVVGGVKRVGTASGDAEMWSARQIDEMLRGLEQKDTTATPTPAEPEGRFAYAPVYFPNSESPDGAVPFRLQPGDERGGVDFVVRLTRMSTIEGVLTGDTSLVSAAQFFFNATGVRLQPLLGVTPTMSTRITPAGRVFTFAGVPPGNYSVTAHVPGSGARTAHFGRVDVVVNGQDVRGLGMSLQPAFSMTGQVVFAGSTGAKPASLPTASIGLTAANGVGQAGAGTTRMGNPLVPPAVIEADGAFRISGLLPEVYTINARVTTTTGWWLRSAVIDGRDVLDNPFEVTGDVTGAVLTFSDQRTQLSGRITTDSGAPGDSLFMAVFPQDRSLWRPQSRRITSARADTDGRWVIQGLPPGDYFLVALTDLAPDELWDPAFLEPLLAASVRVSLADGEQKTQDLRMGR
jgi:hypothetical protein